jgi:hypothetical protein
MLLLNVVTDFKCPGYQMSEYRSDLEDKLQKLLLLEMELDCYVSEMFTYLASYFF